MSGDIPTPEEVKYIQNLLKEDKERFKDHHMNNEPKQQTFIVGQRGPNVQIVIPTKKTPEEIMSEHGLKSIPVITEITTEKEDKKPEKEVKESEEVTEQSPKPRKLRSCANCGEVEPSPRTFKKCQR